MRSEALMGIDAVLAAALAIACGRVENDGASHAKLDTQAEAEPQAEAVDPRPAADPPPAATTEPVDAAVATDAYVHVPVCWGSLCDGHLEYGVTFDTSACRTRQAEACLPTQETVDRIVQECRDLYPFDCGFLSLKTDDVGCISMVMPSMSGQWDTLVCLYTRLAALGPLCEKNLSGASQGFPESELYTVFKDGCTR